MRRGSTAMHAVDVMDAMGRRHRLALRRFVDAERLASDPWYAPRREINALRLLTGAAVQAPRLVAVDPDAEECDVPTLLATRLPGEPPRAPRDLAPFLQQLAETLAAIHAVDGAAAASLPPYRPYDPVPPRAPAWSRRPDVWERALAVVRGDPPRDPRRFIHRDYHPGNTLWSRGRLSGVVDWTAASWGPPSEDVAHMRWNLAVSHGVDAADQFLARWRALTGAWHHPFWDLRDVIDVTFDLDPSRPVQARTIVRLDEYVAAVVTRL